MEAVKIIKFLSGNGNGYGNGDGNGYGDGYGDEIKIQSYKNDPVHYIDGIPCVFQSIKEEYALVEVIDMTSFGTKKMYVAKRYGLFAHGDTLKEAVEQVEEKWIASKTVEEKIEQFKTKFKKGMFYSASLFYDWHSLLTGSCKSGKDMWVNQNRIDLNAQMTVEQFIELTKNAYGGDVIKRLSE